MKRIIIFLLLFAALKVAGQTTGYLRFDTVKIMKQNGTCELYIINKTKDSTGGILTNIGSGLTSFKKSRFVGDTLFVGGDTVIIQAGTSVNYADTSDLISATQGLGNGNSLLLGQFGSTFESPTEVLGLLASYNWNNISVGGTTSTQIKNLFMTVPWEWKKGQIIWSGNNNSGSPQTVLSDIQEMIDSFAHQRYLVMSVHNNTSATKGTPAYDSVIVINNALSALYGDHYVDSRQYLMDRPLTAQDMTDTSNGLIPGSYLLDVIHINNLGYQLISRLLASKSYVLDSIVEDKVLTTKNINWLFSNPPPIGTTERSNAFFKRLGVVGGSEHIDVSIDTSLFNTYATILKSQTAFLNNAATNKPGGIGIRRLSNDNGGYATMDIAGSNDTVWAAGYGIAFRNQSPNIDIGNSANTFVNARGILASRHTMLGASNVNEGGERFLSVWSQQSNRIDAASVTYSGTNSDLYISAPAIFLRAKTGASWGGGDGYNGYGDTVLTVKQRQVGINTSVPDAGLDIKAQIKLTKDSLPLITTIDANQVLVFDTVSRIVGRIDPADLPGGGGGGVSEVFFTDGSGFDGTITNSTTTPTIALTTSLTNTSVPFIGASGALSESNTNLNWNNTNKRIYVDTVSTLRVQTPLVLGGAADASTITFRTTTSGSPSGDMIWQVNSAGDAMRLNSNGRFGIGLPIALNRFHVKSSSAGDGICVDGTNNPALVLRNAETIKGYAPVMVTSTGAFINNSQVNDMGFRSEANRILFGIGSGNSTMFIQQGEVVINATTDAGSFSLQNTGQFYNSSNVSIGTTATPSKLGIETNSLGVTQTNTSGIAVQTTTAAAAGAQQISPAIRWRGNGWKTDATAASQPVDFRAYVVPVQGAAAPFATWRLEAAINDGGYTSLLDVSSSGLSTFSTALSCTGSINTGAGGALYWSGRSVMNSPSDGVIRLANAAQTDFTRLNFGTTDNTRPALQVNGDNLQAVLADGSGYTNVEVFDEAYSSSWNGSNEVPTKNAVYDAALAGLLETISVVTADPTDWNITAGIFTILPDLNGAGGNKVVTFPAASSHTGKRIYVWNNNADANLWSYNAAWTDPDGTTSTVSDNGTFVTFISTGSVWLRMNVH